MLVLSLAYKFRREPSWAIIICSQTNYLPFSHMQSRICKCTTLTRQTDSGREIEDLDLDLNNNF